MKLICLIIEELGWTASPIHFISSINSFFENGWVDWEEIEMKGQWPRPLIKNLWFLLKGGGWASHSLSAIQIKIIFIWAAERRNERSEAGLVAFSSLSFQFMKKRKEERPSPHWNSWRLSLVDWRVGLRGYEPWPAMALREEQLTSTNKLNQMNGNEAMESEWNQPTSRRAAVSLKMKWSGAGCVDGMEGPPAQGHSRNEWVNLFNWWMNEGGFGELPLQGVIQFISWIARAPLLINHNSSFHHIKLNSN